MQKVKFINWGKVSYKEAWDRQEKIFKDNVDIKIHNRKRENEGLEADQQTTHYLIGVEHTPVFTLGKSGDANNLLLAQSVLEAKSIDYYPINRGGDITFHGPGQAVVYPIIDLDNFFTDIHLYLRKLEEVVIKVCAHYGLSAGRVKGLTGVWLGHEEDGSGGQPRKICAMGVKTSRWVTMHGLALNVNTDLSYFDMIVPCGIQDKAVTSLQKELGREVSMQEVFGLIQNYFCEEFGAEIV